MLRVWGRTNSSNVMKVLWLLDELGLACERIDAGLAHGRNDTPEFLAMSPFGLVPALEDGGFALFESNAILRHICRVHAPGTKLHPGEPRALAAMDAWMDVQQTQFSAQSELFRILVRTAPALRDPAAITSGAKAAARAWAVVDARLAKRSFLCGEELTLADIAFGPTVHRWFTLPIERPEAAHLRAWYERLMQRPAYVARCAGALS